MVNTEEPACDALRLKSEDVDERGRVRLLDRDTGPLIALISALNRVHYRVRQIKALLKDTKVSLIFELMLFEPEVFLSKKSFG